MDGQFFPFRSPSGPRSLAAAPGWRCSITCESGRTFSFGKNGNAHTHEAGRPTRVFRSPAPFLLAPSGAPVYPVFTSPFRPCVTFKKSCYFGTPVRRSASQ